MDKVGAGLEFELGFHVGAMGLNGLDADAEGRGDVPAAVSRAHQLEDFELPIRKQFHRGDGIAWACAREILGYSRIFMAKLELGKAVLLGECA